MPLRLSVFMLIAFCWTIASLAQTEASLVTIEASDSLVLQGDFYAQAASAPSVILFHMLGSSRTAYAPLIPALYDAGYNVLNMDLRGHGETGGRQDWELAQTDAQLIFTWLKAQETVQADAIAIIGASIGSNLALIACANESACVTAIALSPGLNYHGLQPEDAVVTGLADRSALLIASQRDRESAPAVKQFADNATGNLLLQLYRGSAHGTTLFLTQLDNLSALLLMWLDSHLK